jgi:hypothetical protein
MTIQRGDYVRPNNPSLGLPLGSVWFVACSAGALKLEAENGIASRAGREATCGCRFPALHFDKVELCNGQWVAVNEVDSLRDAFYPPWAVARSVSGRSQNFQNLPKAQTNAVANAEDDLAKAVSATAAINGLLEITRKLEAERKAELQAAKLAKAKADKEAAAKAKAEEAKRQLSARLHADRCLGEATLALIGEVSRLNNGGAEQMAPHSIAAHVDQLQPLAKSYGYRIAKPSLLAQVVKL